MRLNFNYSIFFEFVVQFIPIPASIIINRLLGSSDRGQLAELLLIPSIISTIIACNWDKILKGELLNSPNSLGKIIGKTFNLFIFQYFFVVLIGLLLFCSGYWSKNQNWVFIIIVVLIQGLAQLTSNYTLSIYSCVASSNKVYKIKLFAALSYLLIVFLFAFFLKIDIYIAFFVNMIIPLVYMASIVYMLKSTLLESLVNFQLNIKDFISKLKFIPVVLFETVSNNIELLILSNFTSHGVLGAYLTFKIIEFPFKIICQAFINVLTPRITSFARIFVFKMSILLITLICASTILILYFESYLHMLVLLLLGESYSDYLWILSYLLIIGALSCSSFVFQNLLILYSEINRYNLIIYITSIFKIILIPSMYYYFNVIGLLGGLILSLFLANIISIYFLRIKT